MCSKPIALAVVVMSETFKFLPSVAACLVAEKLAVFHWSSTAAPTPTPESWKEGDILLAWNVGTPSVKALGWGRLQSTLAFM